MNAVVPRLRKLSLLRLLLSAALLAGGCATHVEVNGSFPEPLSQRLPVTALVVFDEAFRSHRFENADDGREVSVAVGQTQVDLFTAVLNGMFKHVTFADSLPDSAEVDLMIMPVVDEVQISMPYQTRLKVYEVWVRYNLRVFEGSGEPLADWIMSAYGKTPTRFLKSSGDALNQAALVAMRDAGAHFIIGFSRVPEIRFWLDGRATVAAGLPEMEP